MAREMKDSGVEWLKEIPNSWQITRIGGLYKIRNTKVSDEDFPPLSVTMQGIVPQLDTAAKTNDHNNRKLVKKGDFAINSRSDRRGSCGLSEYDGSVSLINTVLEPLSTMNSKYYGWLFHTVQFADEFYRWGHGIVDDLWTTGWEDMKKITVPVPPLSEQESISSFLDCKCSEIDALSDDIQSEINKLEEYKKSVITEAITKGLDETVEMKDSGIKWIGKIPDSWEVTRLKYVLKEPMKYGASETGIDYNQSLPRYIRITDITLDGHLKNTGKLSLSEEAAQKYLLADKTILFARSGATVGKAFMYRKEYGRAAFAGYLISAVVDRNKMLPEWLLYYTSSSAYSEWVKTIFTQATIQNIGADKYSDMPIPISKNLELQLKILRFLESKCSEIDSVISNKKRQLSILDLYKKSLIYEYVTGKKEVPLS